MQADEIKAINRRHVMFPWTANANIDPKVIRDAEGVYIIDDDGKVQGANCIIPTGQNYANMEADMRALVPQILDKPQPEITHMMEMLIRAYDPCISCSTHFLDVKFV